MSEPRFLEPLNQSEINGRDLPTTAIDVRMKQVLSRPDLVHARKCPNRAFSLYPFRALEQFPVSLPLW
jgi:hypothetical protein